MKKSNSKKKDKEMSIPFWLLDGFVGILALMIYNFCLYLLVMALGIKGVAEKMNDAMGYFLLNSFIDFGFTTSQMTIGLFLVFIFSFFLGIFVGKIVRVKRRILTK